MTCTSTCHKPRGRQAHCSACHRSFTAVSAFDHHRIGHVKARTCADPADRGMHLTAHGVWARQGGPRFWPTRAHDSGGTQGAETGPVVPRDTPGHFEAAETISGGSAWPNRVRCPVVDDWCPGNADGVLCTQPCNPREDS